MSDDAPEYGYEPEADANADPHGPDVGVDATERSWRRLGHALTNARSVRDLLRTIRGYGWAPPFLGLLTYGLARGVFEYLAEPFAMSQGYAFPGWQLAFGINLVYGIFFAGFSWFLYFGVIGSLAGFFSETTTMERAIFKVGGYLMALFVPAMIVGAALVLTIPPPETVVAGAESATEVAETHGAVADSLQMRIVDAVLAGAWILVGFLMLPVVSELYDVDSKASVLSVLPVTLVAVVATQLV